MSVPDSAGDELAYASIASLGPRLASREVSPVEVARACLERIAALDERVNAFITVLGDQALEAAGRAEREIQQGAYRGPLHGIPIALKDLYYTAGIRTTRLDRIPSRCIHPSATGPTKSAATVGS